MPSHFSHGNAVTAIAIGIVVTFVSDIETKNGCDFPAWKPYISIVFANNFSEITNSFICFPVNTELLYVCKYGETHQVSPKANLDHLFGKCTAAGWLNRDDTPWVLPKCERRENHCRSPLANNSNMFVQIHGQNISIEHNNTSLNYTVETVAIFKCTNPKSNASQEWRCKENNKIYSWKQKPSEKKDCGVPTESSTKIPENDDNRKSTVTENILSASETSTQSKELFSAFPSRSGNLSDLLIGICSFLGFIMIAVLFGLLYKNRARLGKRYNNTANQHARQSPFTSMPEGENQSKGKFADGEENLVYANIIPIKVNQETIYAEVETGKIGKSRPTNIKLTIDDDQLHTTYAEIRHSVIPKDQHR